MLKLNVGFIGKRIWPVHWSVDCQTKHGYQGDERAELDAQLESLKQENKKLRQQQAETAKTTTSDDAESIKDLRKQLAKEIRDREAAERRHSHSEAQRESQKTVLNEKVEQYRTKLKATKDKLKEVENLVQNTKNEHDTDLDTGRFFSRWVQVSGDDNQSYFG